MTNSYWVTSNNGNWLKARNIKFCQKAAQLAKSHAAEAIADD